jgi:hypothetical protein
LVNGGNGGSGVVVIRYPIAIQTPGEFIVATGGATSVINVGNESYAVHTFANIGKDTFRVTSAGSVADNNLVEYLVIAGGGGGGQNAGAGGGAGG